MSEVESGAPHNPLRGREARAAQTGRERRRRKGGSLNRMVSMKLDVFGADQLDMENYVYRWVNDDPGRMRMATVNDDYDFVETSEIKDYNADATDSVGERVRMLAGTGKNGEPTYTYLLRKRRDWFEDDQNEVVMAREAMMEGRVYQGQVDAGLDEEDAKKVAQEKGNFYVPKGEVSLGGLGRRRGPISRK